MIDEDTTTHHFTLTLMECKLISLGARMLARAAYEGGDIPAMDMANALASRFSPRTIKEAAERANG